MTSIPTWTPNPGPHLAGAIDELLADLDRSHARLRALERDTADAKSRQAAIRTALERTLALFPRQERANAAARIVRIDQRYRMPEAGKRLQSPDPDRRTDAIRHFLATRDAETFQVRELTQWLEAEGFQLRPRYAANTLHFMEKQGYVTRAGYGRYTVNRLHPILLDMQIKILEGETGAL